MRFATHKIRQAASSEAALSFLICGLYGLGHVGEWVDDCSHFNYKDAPSDGSAWTSGCDSEKRVLRGDA